MKKLITAIVCATPLLVFAVNWTNYPVVIEPNDSDTLMLGVSPTNNGAMNTNKQWAVSNMTARARLLPSVAKAANIVVTNEVVVVATNSSLVFQLPNSTNKPGRQIWFYNHLGATNTSVRYTNGMIVSDGLSSTNYTLTNAGKSLYLYAYGTNWFAR